MSLMKDLSVKTLKCVSSLKKWNRMKIIHSQVINMDYRQYSMGKIYKYIIWMSGIIVIICITLMLICNHLVVNNAKGKAFSEIDSIKYNKVGLLLGTTPQARIGRITNYFFVYRIERITGSLSLHSDREYQ